MALIVAGALQITNNIYDAREGFYFERQMPRLRPSQLLPGSVIVMEFLITQRGQLENIERAFRAQSAFLLWAPPVAPHAEVEVDNGPTLAQVLGLGDE